MNPLIRMLAGQLGGPILQQIGQQIGSDEGTTKSAIGMALPMLVSAMGNHAGTPEGANAIHQATQEHDGSILDNLMGVIGSGAAGNMGGALLGQVLGGGQHNAIADAIGQNTGMNSGAASQLLSILAPIVMGGLGKVSQQQGGLDPNGIAQLLGMMGGNNDMLGMATKMLDADGDGNIAEDIGNLINKIF